MHQNERNNPHAPMPTAAERQALAFLAGVALLGGGVRVWQQRHDATRLSVASAYSDDAESVDGQLFAVDAMRASKRSKKGPSKSKGTSGAAPNKRANSRPRKSGDDEAPEMRPIVIDVDVANVQELEKLPRVGLALAKRIVANRDSLGAFGSLETLGTVRGIGDAMLKTLDPLVTFSGRPRAPASATNEPRKSRRTRKS